MLFACPCIVDGYREIDKVFLDKLVVCCKILNSSMTLSYCQVIPEKQSESKVFFFSRSVHKKTWSDAFLSYCVEFSLGVNTSNRIRVFMPFSPQPCSLSYWVLHSVLIGLDLLCSALIGSCWARLSLGLASTSSLQSTEWGRERNKESKTVAQSRASAIIHCQLCSSMVTAYYILNERCATYQTL